MESPKRRLPSNARRRPGRPSFNSVQTRAALLDAAEELFAAFGVEGVSIRSVNAAASFAPTAVHRHYGSKDRLLAAVMRRRGDAIATRQRELLDALALDGRKLTPLRLVETWAIPYRELVAQDAVGGLRWLRLLARLLLAQDPGMIKLSSALGLEERVARVASLVFPGVPEQQLQGGLLIGLGTLLQMMANRDMWTAPGAEGKDRGRANANMDMLVRFVAAGLAELAAPQPQSAVRNFHGLARVRQAGRDKRRGKSA